MKEVLKKLFLRSLAGLALERVIPEKVSFRDGILVVEDERIEVQRYKRIVCVALGKAAGPMAEVVAAILDPYPLMGVISSLATHGRRLPGFLYFYGGHPYPNGASFQAGETVVELLQAVTPRDLVLYLLSGGGSAICEKPIFPDIPPADYREFHKLLVTCGARVLDVNFIRKHFSAIKGGRLTQLAGRARQLTLYVSDAPRGSPSNVASGPTMPDESAAGDCYAIIEKYGLRSRLPLSIRRVFDERRIPETPKPGCEIFRNSSWHCLLAPEDAIEVLSEQTRRLGWVVETDLTVNDDCPLEPATCHLLRKLEKLKLEHPTRTVAILTGGEYSCPVQGDGLGGRNQAFVLHSVNRIAGRNIAVLSAGTDGVDGTSPAAGAVADGETLERACRLGLNPRAYEERSDSYGFFSRLGDTVETGPTGNNVRDLRLLVAW